MKPFNWKLTSGLVLVSALTGLMFAYFQFNPWGRKNPALSIFIEQGSPLFDEKTKKILEFYLERKVNLHFIENASEVRPFLVMSKHEDILIFSSWNLSHRLINEGLMVAWGSALQDTLTSEMRLSPQFIPLVWDMNVEWTTKLTNKETPPSQCPIPLGKKATIHSLPKAHDWFPKYADFKTTKKTSELLLWGFSYAGNGNVRDTDIEIGLYKLTMSKIFEQMLNRLSLGVTLRRFERNSDTPRVRRSSLIRDIPLDQFRIRG